MPAESGRVRSNLIRHRGNGRIPRRENHRRPGNGDGSGRSLCPRLTSVHQSAINTCGHDELSPSSSSSSSSSLPPSLPSLYPSLPPSSTVRIIYYAKMSENEGEMRACDMKKRKCINKRKRNIYLCHVVRLSNAQQQQQIIKTKNGRLGKKLVTDLIFFLMLFQCLFPFRATPFHTCSNTRESFYSQSLSSFSSVLVSEFTSSNAGVSRFVSGVELPIESVRFPGEPRANPGRTPGEPRLNPGRTPVDSPSRPFESGSDPGRLPPPRPVEPRSRSVESRTPGRLRVKAVGTPIKAGRTAVKADRLRRSHHQRRI